MNSLTIDAGTHMVFDDVLACPVSGTNIDNLNNLKEYVNAITEELEYNEDVKGFIDNLFDKIIQSTSDIKISRTNESTFLMYKEYKPDSYINLIVDEDGDVEILMIPKKRSNIKNLNIYRSDKISTDDIVKKFNEWG